MNETASDSPLALLAHLDRARSSIADYYLPLRDHQDEVVRVGAWLTLVSCRELPVELLPGLVAMAGYGAIRRLAFDLLAEIYERDLAEKVAATAPVDSSHADVDAMRAEAVDDLAGAAAAHRRLYLATGRIDALFAEVDFTYQSSGAMAALPLAARNVAINPHEPLGAVRLVQLGREVQSTELLDEVAARLQPLHPYAAAVSAACALQLGGHPKEALLRARALDGIEAPPAVKAKLHRTVWRMVGECLDRIGDYRQAYQGFVQMNAPVEGEKPDFWLMRDSVAAAKSYDIPQLPAEDRGGWFMMLGFPRSGTTLLENALASHPEIETFEELPTRPAMRMYVDWHLPRAGTPEQRASVFEEARRRYYREMERVRRNPGAKVFIDKMPTASIDADLLVRVFPDKRYIFSIRHPFDVVLSCLRQGFAPNAAMDNFRTFEAACQFYDFTMAEWFAKFGLDDRRVQYVRYEDLVERFEPTIRQTLSFLGAQWHPGVLDFASTAARRSAKTPSYQKVRQGLSLGVQSSWRNYRFLFESEAATPLRRWVQHFGYPAQ